MSNIAIKYRIYPSADQQVLLNKTFGCCRKIWNLMLSDKIDHYKATGQALNTTPAAYKSAHPYLKEVDSLALANVQMNLQAAYKKFFKEKKGFPKFKSAKTSRKSYTTNNQGNTIKLLSNGIRLPKVGIIKAIIHRQPQPDWELKSATISQASDGCYYVSVLFEYDHVITPVSVDPDKAIGLDYKSDGLYMDSNGNVGSNHKFYRESQAKLAKAQRKLSRMTPGSRNFEKQKLRVNKIHCHIANQRLDNLHKLSTEIANQYDVVCVESLDIKAVSNKGFGNGKATMDNGYGIFLTLLQYKLLNRGKYFIKIDKWYPSSQLCSCCGSRQKLKLTDRVYICPNCGLIIDRDENAAINIKEEGLRLLLAT